MQDLDFIAVNSPSAKDTKDGSACESVASLEIHISTLEWSTLLWNEVRERILT